MTEKHLSIDDFTFHIRNDPCADPLSAIEVWVFFADEPCCDDNGHQYRFYLPIGIRDESLRDMCRAFTLAVHCQPFASAAA